MKHSLKSMLSLALALVMIFSIFLVPSVSAEEGILDTEVVTEPVEETNTTEPIETVEPAAETVDENNAAESTDEMEAEDPSENETEEILSDVNVESEISMATAAPLPEITAQPVDQLVSAGDTVTFTVVAENADSYQWQVDRNDGKGFVNLSKSTTWKNTKTASLSFKAKEAHLAYKFRCVVKNAAGEVISDVVGISMQTLPTITTQPVDQVASVGDTVKFTVVADDAESYQWQIDRNNGKGFVNLSNSTTWKNTKTATLSFKAADVHQAYKFRCVVKNAAGEVISDEVGISFEESQWVIDGVVYGKLTETTVILLNYTGTAETLTIPELVEGKTVVEIAVEAFMDNTNLVSIDLPDTITVIHARAFKGCVNLREMK